MDRASVLIVGHGPSLKGAKRGQEIDSHTNIVRFSDSFFWSNGEDYGVKTDYILATDQNANDLLNANIVPKEAWIYSRPDSMVGPRRAWFLERFAKYNPVICQETWRWSKRFRDMDAWGYRSPRHPDEPHFSQGMAAIIIAADRLRPGVIVLAGFDNLMAGNSEDFKSLASTGTPRMHDMETERKLLDEVKDWYGFDLVSFD